MHDNWSAEMCSITIKTYLNWEDLCRAIGYDIEREHACTCKGKCPDERMKTQ